MTLAIHPTRSKVSPPNLSNAQWIWTEEVHDGDIPPAGARPFRKPFLLRHQVNSVTIDITSDSYDTLYVNGKIVGSTIMGGCEWKNARRYTVRFGATKHLVIAVWAEQSIRLGQAGLVLAGVAWNSDEENPSTFPFNTDGCWEATPETVSVEEFKEALKWGYDSDWDQVVVQGSFDSAQPWAGKVLKPTEESPLSGRLINVPGNSDAPDAPHADAW